MTSKSFFQNVFILRRSGVAISADIIKIVTKFIKTILKDSKLEELKIMYLNGIYIWISWYSKICWFPVKNADVSRTQEVCHVIYLIFESSLGKV